MTNCLSVLYWLPSEIAAEFKLEEKQGFSLKFYLVNMKPLKKKNLSVSIPATQRCI